MIWNVLYEYPAIKCLADLPCAKYYIIFQVQRNCC